MSATRRLREIMARLRDPDGGCPWDLEQDFQSIAPYTIEEAYEVDDAIRREDPDALRDELGDLLLQVVYHARMAEERDWFDYEAVAEAICDKLVRRHPHVFGDADRDALREDFGEGTWDGHKEAERRARAAAEGRAPSRMDDVPLGLPALLRATKLTRRAERAGLDWEATWPDFEAWRERLAGADEAAFGAALLACARLAQQSGVDPEAALRAAGARFERRFRACESAGHAAGEDDPEALRRRWEAFKPPAAE